MKKSPIIELQHNMLLDKDYINFEKLYNEENIIDKKILIKLLNKYEDLYIIFLKINIWLYNYDARCRKALKYIVTNSLKPKCEIAIIRKILNRNTENELLFNFYK